MTDNIKNDIILYEELSMNAHPAIRTQLFDGWVMRFAYGYTKRANSINPLYQSAIPINEKLKHCEMIYYLHGLPVVFKLTPSTTGGLDGILEEQGYLKVTPTNVMIKELKSPVLFDSKTTILNDFDERWLEGFFRLISMSDNLIKNTIITMQNNILGKPFYASIIEQGVTVACGLCVVEREYAGLFDIFVDSNHRGKGLGYDICTSLLNSAFEAGAKTAYLQVVDDNNPALALYNKMGFHNCYQYWYRSKKVDLDI